MKQLKSFRWPAWLRFEILWVIILLICGGTMVFSMPPFQVMDEYKHFYKSYAIAQGNLVCSMDPESKTMGFFIPQKIRDAGQAMGIQEMEYRYDRKITAEELARAKGVTELGPDVFVQHPFCETPFWSSMPQAVGVKIAQIFGMDLQGIFYAGRLMSFLVTTTVLFFAMRLLPFGKYLFGLVTLLPMFLQQIASYSLDSLQYGLLFLFFASTLALAKNTKPIQPKVLAWFALLSVVAVYAKIGYMPLVLLVFLIPQKAFPSKRWYWFYTLGLVGVHLLAFLTLRSIFTAGDIVDAGTVSRSGQIMWVLTHPLEYVGVLLNTFDIYHNFYWENVLGVLGWMDYRLHGGHYIMLAALIFFLVAGIDPDKESPFAPWQRWLMISIFSANTLLLMSILYAIDDPVGNSVISLMQGKYLLPILPLVLFSLYQLRISERTRQIVVLVVMLCTFPAVLFVQNQRYYDTRMVDIVPNTPENTSVVTVTPTNIFRQIFVSRENNLQGVSFWLANKTDRPEGAVTLLLKDADCQEILYSTFIRESDIVTDGYYHFRFPLREDSKDKQYCLQFHPTLRTGKVPLRVLTTKTDTFKDGIARLGDNELPGDLVMMLGYSNR